MIDVRMWPAKEYTRVTLEHDQPIKFKYFMVRSPMPYRLVVDIEGLTLTARLQKMISDVSPNDPYTTQQFTCHFLTIKINKRTIIIQTI